MPMRTVGTASAMNIHFHPARPRMPSSPSNPVEIGAPSATAPGKAKVKPDMMRARWRSGNQ